MMITRLDCSEDTSGEISVNEANILHFLGTIEDYTNRILNDHYFIQVNSEQEHEIDDEILSSSKAKDSDQLHYVIGVGPTLPMAAESMNVNPPKLLDYSSDENSVDDGDTGSRPLTLEEVKSKMKARINNQQRRKNPKNENQVNGRRGSILTRRRSSLLVKDIGPSMMSRRSTTIGIVSNS